MRGFPALGSEASKVAVTHVIAENNDNIGLFRRLRKAEKTHTE